MDMLSTTTRTPGVAQAAVLARSRPDQLLTVPPSVTLAPETATEIFLASALATRLSAASISALTALRPPAGA